MTATARPGTANFVGPRPEFDGYGVAQRSEWLDIDWQEHLRPFIDHHLHSGVSMHQFFTPANRTEPASERRGSATPWEHRTARRSSVGRLLESYGRPPIGGRGRRLPGRSLAMYQEVVTWRCR